MEDMNPKATLFFGTRVMLAKDDRLVVKEAQGAFGVVVSPSSQGQFVVEMIKANPHFNCVLLENPPDINRPLRLMEDRTLVIVG